MKDILIQQFIGLFIFYNFILIYLIFAHFIEFDKLYSERYLFYIRASLIITIFPLFYCIIFDLYI